MCCRYGPGTHALIKPTGSTNGPVENVRFRSGLLLSFRNPPSSASRAVLAVFWTWWDGDAVVGIGLWLLRRPATRTDGVLRCETCQTTQTLVVM
jgi:hypothetical protein